MEKKTKTVLIVVVIVFLGLTAYNIYDNYKIKVEYDYSLEYCPYYSDSNGIHYPSSGHKFINARITQLNVSNDCVISLPNCYSLESSDGSVYEWKTGTTDRTEIYNGGVAHIIITFEVPASFTTGKVIWNVPYVKAVHVDL